MNKLSKLALLFFLLYTSSCGKKDAQHKEIPCLPGNLSGSVIAFYPFSNGSLQDISGNNQHLVSIGSATPAADRDGNPSCAYAFDNVAAATAYLTRANPVFLNNLDEFSISLWYTLTDSTRNPALYSTLIGRDSGARCPDRSGQWALGIFDCSKAVFGTTNSVWDRYITPAGNCQDEARERYNSWHHAVATYKKTSSTIALYRDGVLQDIKSGAVSCGFTGMPTMQDLGDLFLGLDFTGKLDDVVLFNKALNQSEVTLLYNTPTCCSGGQ